MLQITQISAVHAEILAECKGQQTISTCVADVLN
jgi:hypothetical protein